MSGSIGKHNGQVNIVFNLELRDLGCNLAMDLHYVLWLRKLGKMSFSTLRRVNKCWEIVGHKLTKRWRLNCDEAASIPETKTTLRRESIDASDSSWWAMTSEWIITAL